MKYQLDSEFEKDFQVFKKIILLFLSGPFPYKQLNKLLKEMDEQEIRSLSNSMNIRVRFPVNIAHLMQLLRIKLNKDRGKIRLLQSILHLTMGIFEEDNQVLEDTELLLMEEKRREQYGDWHYYWGLRLYPHESEVISKRIYELEKELLHVKPMVQGINIPDHHKVGDTKAKTNMIIQRERELRIEAEEQVNRLNKELRKINAQVTSSNYKITQLQLSNELSNKELTKVIDLYQREQMRTSQLKHEKNNMENKINSYELRISELKKTISDLEKNHKIEIRDMKQRLSDYDSLEVLLDALIDKLSNLSYLKMRELTIKREEIKQRPELRSQISDILVMINHLENFSYSLSHKHSSNHSELGAQEVAAATSTEIKEFVENEVKSETEKLGTFYRKLHGGIIQFVDGGTIVITESIVNAVGLEHEAEVECVPRKREDGSEFYHIRILFQGDSFNSPIEQHLGYIELGPHQTHYCVDINNPENRYPIHERDFSIQQPNIGDPCLVNVSNNSPVARLSKVFKDQNEIQSVKEKTHRLRRSKSSKDSAAEPFLEGCKIAIIGGQAKWFETVVKETGASFVHENGENPERIFAELKKSNALFLLTTATSHVATNAGINIAKKYNIPHFTIEGSKSNLRSILREQRKVIINHKSS